MTRVWVWLSSVASYLCAATRGAAASETSLRRQPCKRFIPESRFALPDREPGLAGHYPLQQDSCNCLNVYKMFLELIKEEPSRIRPTLQNMG